MDNKMAHVVVVLMTRYQHHLVWFTWKSAIDRDWIRWLSPLTIHSISSNIYIGYRNSLISLSPQLVLVSQLLVHNLCLISVFPSDLCNKVVISSSRALKCRGAVEMSVSEVLFIRFKTNYQIFLSSSSLALTK
jgi:hypothetical protein